MAACGKPKPFEAPLAWKCWSYGGPNGRGARQTEVGIRSRFTKSRRFARATSSRLHQRSHSRIVANALRDPTRGGTHPGV